MKTWPIRMLLSAACAALPVVAPAQDTEPWQPAIPDGLPTDFDWMQLPSGEWLKGEIVSMYDGELEFDSDELGVLSFDFGDIRRIRSSQVVQVGFEHRESIIGRLMMDSEIAAVVGDAGEVEEFDRSEILTLIAGTPKEINYWSGDASVGGNIRSGNTEQIDYTARLGLMRRSVKDRAVFSYIGNITRIDAEDTSNNHRATLGWDRFLNQRLFIKVAGVEWYRDPFQNIANRWSATVGVGYEIIDTGRTSWNASAGPAWQRTEWTSVEPGEDNTADTPAFRFGSDLDHELTGDIDVYATYSAFVTNEASGTYSHHFDTGIEIELIGNLDFNVSWVWDYIQDPRPLEDGSVPEENDTRLIFGLGWSF